MKTLLSIVIPVYNTYPRLVDTINSVSQIDAFNYEIIIIDDGSTDKTQEYLEQLNNNNIANLKVYRQKNHGVSAARNSGIKLSKGKYILFLDGDDLIDSRVISYLNEVDSDQDIILFKYRTSFLDKNRVINYKGKSGKVKNLRGIDVLNSIFLNHQDRFYLLTPNMIYNKDFIIRNNIQYTVGCRRGQDGEFQYKALTYADKVDFYPFYITTYIVHSKSVSQQYNLNIFDQFYALVRVKEYILEYLEIKPNSSSNRKSSISIKGVSRKIYLNFLYSYIRSIKRNNNMIKLNRCIISDFPNIFKELQHNTKNIFFINLQPKSLIESLIILITKPLFNFFSTIY